MRRAGIAEPEKLFASYRHRVPEANDGANLRSAFLSDAPYRRPAARLAQAPVAAGGRAYHYLVLDEPCGPAMGAFHGVDLLHVFDKLSLVGAATPEHLGARDTLAGAWAAFAVWPTGA
ncbi:hypothetical protein [Streptomyces sp. NPDC002491]